MSELKERLRADLTASMKARDELTTATLRMVLTAVQIEEVAGDRAQQLTDEEILGVLRREMKKRREAATAFADAGRVESAARERAESQVLETYLPSQLSDDELADLVRAAIGQSGASGMRALGQVIKATQAGADGRAEGGRIAAEARRQLGANE